ncbi:hypothetical protein ACFSYC_15320 [Mucilaginibacter antarcticus]|uniref:Uncharacterized protein n=1 Tax=Mucilaginibacter antarcticus TaxID=1855725 RepID=A0ABW5XRV0_9SPHI
MPDTEYSGSVTINYRELAMPLTIKYFKNNQHIQLIKDTNSLKYGLNIYFAYLGDRKFTLWADKNDEEITSLYF